MFKSPRLKGKKSQNVFVNGLEYRRYDLIFPIYQAVPVKSKANLAWNF